MSFSLKGYVLEKPRVGTVNSPYTLTPNNGVLTVADQAAYSAAFNDSETLPRVEYMTLATVDGDLADVEFGWTKNEDIQRFDWDGKAQRYTTLPGAPPTQVTAALDPAQANVQRLTIIVPRSPLVSYPYRLYAGSVGSGTTLILDLVDDETGFVPPPPVGHVQLSKATGTLNWNSTDLATYSGQPLHFQRQTFFQKKDVTGSIGTIPATGLTDFLLNPIPGVGQFPLVRFGFGLTLQAEAVANEGLFTTPDPGSFQWAEDTGLIRFNALDFANHRGSPVYYDGCLLATKLQLPRQTIGTSSAPGVISPMPLSGGELILRATTVISSGTATFPDSGTLQDTLANFSSPAVLVGDVVVITSGLFAGTRRKVTSVISTTQLGVQPSFPSLAGASYNIERLVYQWGETDRYPTLANAPAPKAGVAQVDDTGAVRFSTQDQVAYGAFPLQVVVGDLLLERGLSMRFFRTPVNTQALDPTLKDLSIFYPTTNSTIANPVVGFPMAILPILPIDDPAYPMAFHITQGTGSFTGDLLRLDIPSPPDGLGYTIDFDAGMIKYAVRKSGVLVPIVRPAEHVQLPDPIVDPNNIVLELDQGFGFVPLVLDQNAILEPTSGTVVFASTQGVFKDSGRASTFNGTVLTDPTKDFLVDGVLQGDYLVIPAGLSQGVYDIAAVTTTTLTLSEAAPSLVTDVGYEVRRGKEVMADRFFRTISLADPNTVVEKIRSLGVATNSPRLNVLPSLISATRFRFGQTTFVTPTVVANDGAFTAPGSLPVGQMEISTATGNLNFSSGDVGSTAIFWSNRLIEGKDYRIGAARGLVQLNERLLSNDEVLVSYQPLDDVNNPPVTPTPYQVERATFQVRKELAAHLTQGSTATFNPLGRTIAMNPPPQVYRGGRPQDATKVSIDTMSSTITFLPDSQLTNAIPHGSVLLPSENVHVDYYIYNALGGENTTQVLLPPITYAIVNMVEGATSFAVPGNHLADFPADSILRVDRTELYYLAAPSFSGGVTTVNLLAPQVIRESRQQPVLEVTSGPTRAINATFFSPSYFVVDSSFTSPIPRGMNKFDLVGDLSKTYLKGTLVYFTDGSTCNDFLFCEGSSFNGTKGVTSLTFSNPTPRQYTPGTHTMRRSLRPVLEAVATSTSTSRSPILSEGFLIFRQVVGQPGQILMNVAKSGAIPTSVDVAIDSSGSVVFGTPLQPSEEFSIFYTGFQTISSGTLRAAYTANIVPNDVNGLNNQVFTGDFTAYSPDTFYFRVETMVNFQGEIAQQYKDASTASVPSGGPNTSNASGTPLYKQGRPSVFFDEGHLGNEDIIARATLLFYNDAINDLEDVLQNFDGRVVGDADGRFLFDGTTGTVRTSFAAVENQIDDTFQISQFPVSYNGSTFTVIGTYQKVYLPGTTSRFFKTMRNAFGITIAGHNSVSKPNTGDAVLDLGVKKISNVGTIFKRTPRALILEDVPAGSNTITVDDAAQAILAPDGVTALLRPAFQTNERVIIPGFLDDPSTTIVTGISGNVVTLSAGVPVAVPHGATLTLSNTDSTAQAPIGYQQSYRGNYDVGIDAEKGLLTYIDPYFPFDGTMPLVPEPLIIHPVDEKEMLQASVSFYNTATAPNKFPALYGQALTDDGDQAVPFINPSPTSEGVLLQDELALEAPTGPILTGTTAPFLGTATLDVTQTILTLTTPVSFPAPVPQVNDLVRILTGANANSNFYRISAVSVNTVTVETPFPFAEGGSVSILVTVAANLHTGTVTTPSTSTVNDAAVIDFGLLGVEVGHTFIFTSGVNAKARRQIVGISTNTLTLDHPVTLGGGGYRIANPFNTYSGMAGLIADLDGELAALTGLVSTPNSEKVALDNFFNTVFQDITTPGGVSGTTALPTTLTAALSVDFLALGVGPQHFVYIESGPNEGVYPVATVTGAQTLLVEASTPFPSAAAVTFRIVSVFGVTKTTLLAISLVRTAIDQYVTSIPPFRALLATLVPVSTVSFPAGDPNIYAIGAVPSDIATRYTEVQARIAAISSPTGYITEVSSALTSGDRLYDKRYTWIDARINLQNGILTQIQQSVAKRIQAQQDTVNALIKLLALQGT